MVKLRCVIVGSNVLFVCIIALIYHLSVKFLDICRCPGNFRKTSSKFRKFIFSDCFLFPGNLVSLTGFYFPEISLSDWLWSGERTISHRNFLRIFLQCILLCKMSIFKILSRQLVYCTWTYHSRSFDYLTKSMHCNKSGECASTTVYPDSVYLIHMETHSTRTVSGQCVHEIQLTEFKIRQLMHELYYVWNMPEKLF